MTNARLASFALCGLLLPALGCSKTSSSAPAATAAPADPAFDSKWSQLATSGIEAAYIEDDRGQGLMGNVRRTTDVRPDPNAMLAPPSTDPNAPLPERPAGEEIQKIIRGNLTAVKGCYMSMTRAGVTRSGKAIVTFEIGADGKPGAVKVEAPTFTGTDLPGCVGGQVARWAFPKSQKGGGAVSYPFVFVGG